MEFTISKGIAGCCRNCENRYPACHDHCEKYINARQKWDEERQHIRESKADIYDVYKIEKRRGKK